MNNRIISIYFVIGLLLSVFVFFLSYIEKTKLPGNHIGYEPMQPINYSHRLHAGELQIQCQFCHTGIDKGKHAAIPSLSTCMNCHKQIYAPFLEMEKAKKSGQKKNSPEIKKIYDAVGFDFKTSDYNKNAETHLIEWKKIHNLPDFVYFDHSVHVGSGVQCQSCHGEVQTMERVRQVNDLSMGWCVNCHRDLNLNGLNGKKVNAPTDCSACHY